MTDIVNVKVKRLRPDAVIPTRATSGAAGFDLYAVEDVIIAPGETKMIPLGLAFEIPKGHVMYVMPRSGVSLRTKLRQPNSVGVIDSDYRGEIAMMFDNIAEDHDFPTTEELVLYTDGNARIADEDENNASYQIRKGDRIAQAVIQRVPSVQFTEVDELTDTARGEGGFGSTGTRNPHAEHFAAPMGKELV